MPPLARRWATRRQIGATGETKDDPRKHHHRMFTGRRPRFHVVEFVGDVSARRRWEPRRLDTRGCSEKEAQGERLALGECSGGSRAQRSPELRLPPVDPPPPAADSPLEPSAGTPACPQGRVEKLIRDLSSWSAHRRDNERTVALARGCDEPDVICLDRLGELASDSLPLRVKAGRPISVFVILPFLDRGRISIALSGKGEPGAVASRR